LTVANFPAQRKKFRQQQHKTSEGQIDSAREEHTQSSSSFSLFATLYMLVVLLRKETTTRQQTPYTLFSAVVAEYKYTIIYSI
jgi:hypothetical protein